MENKAKSGGYARYMIPYDVVNAWGVAHPWISREQIEQDMLLSRAICDIYSNNLLSKELVFRGGTALNKLVLPRPYRYSEDLDFVRSSAGGIGDIMKELTYIGKQSGFLVKTKMGIYPKLYWQCVAQTGRILKIKIEINTYERNSALPVAEIEHSVATDWYSCKAIARVFQNEELAATKIRALYQRTKGRDLFDLWLLATKVGLNTEAVLLAFSKYRPDGFTAKNSIDNLEKKLRDVKFVSDINNLLASDGLVYSIEDAASYVIEQYLQNL